MGFGDNTSGSVGCGMGLLSLFDKVGNNASCPVPTRVLLDSEIVSISSGWNHTLTLTKEGQLLTWGKNDEGQLGTGDQSSCQLPEQVEIPTSSPPIQVVCGRDSSYAFPSFSSILISHLSSSASGFRLLAHCS
jgi:alpha-tubulin suppressor-like RCC1 family protein